MATKKTENLVSRADLAAKYKCTPATLINWEKQGMPLAFIDDKDRKSRWYDPVAVDEWYQNHFNTTESIDEAELRKKRADATLAEIKVLKARGELIRSDAVVSFVGAELSNVRSKLIALSGLIAPHIYIDDLAVRIKIIDDAVEQVLAEISSDTLTPRDWVDYASDDTD